MGNERKMGKNSLERMQGILPYMAVFVASVLSWPSFASADENMKRRLASGDILTTSVPTPKGVRPGRAMGVVNAPPSVVARMLADVDRYKEFMPCIRESRKVGDGLFEVKCELPWPIKDAWARVKVRSGVRNGVKVVQWWMVKGTLDSYDGVAWIQPWGEGKSLVIYQMRAVPSIPAPNSLLDRGMRSAAKDVLETLRERAVKVMAGTVYKNKGVVAHR